MLSLKELGLCLYDIFSDDVEEMEASYDTATSPGADESITSTSTVRSPGLHISVSPQSMSPPKTPPKRGSPVSPTVSFRPRVPGSPSVKIPGSPTVKISKSAVSSYAGSDSEPTRTVTQTAGERSPVKEEKDSEPVDLTESDDNMETDTTSHDADVSSSEIETGEEKPPELEKEVVDKEIFKQYEEISPDEVLEGEIEEMDVVTSSTGTEREVSEVVEIKEPANESMKIEQEEVGILFSAHSSRYGTFIN